MEETKRLSDDYWYEHRNELRPDMIFKLYDGSTIKLDRRVPGDGTQWYAATLHDAEGYYRGWCYDNYTIEPGDLRGLPMRPEEV